MRSRIGCIVGVAAVLVAAGCSSHLPVQTWRASPDTTESAAPSAGPVAALPQPRCDPPHVFPPAEDASEYPFGSTLTCADAVAAAAAVLPAVHPRILAVEFHYGSQHCRSGTFCLVLSGNDGYVLFVTDLTPPRVGIIVTVTADAEGRVTVTAGPTPFPSEPGPPHTVRT